MGKHQQNQNFFLFFSNLRHIEYDKVDVMCIVHSYNMDDKIRKMNINVAFEYICQKEWSCNL